MVLLRFFGFCLVLLLVPREVKPWGIEGHKIIAQLGYNHLTSRAKSSVQRFTTSTTRSFSLADICTGADDYRYTPQGAWSAPCHYINAEKGQEHITLEQNCPQFCVVKSLQNYTSRMKQDWNQAKHRAFPSHSTYCNFTLGAEPCALQFYVHYIGDVHQPLHTGYADDRGGNSVIVDFFGTRRNLHEVWDSFILLRWQTDWEAATHELEGMISSDPDVIEKYENSRDPLEWANESYEIVKTLAYNFTDSGNSTLPIIGDAYFARALPVLKQRLIAGGIRLAYTWNSMLDNSQVNDDKLEDMESETQWVLALNISLCVLLAGLLIVISFGILYFVHKLRG